MADEPKEKDEDEEQPDHLSEKELEESGDNLDESILEGEGPPPK
jgi:hypothetical protein